MHFHMSLLDANKHNIFSCSERDFAKPLLNVISGLIHFMQDSMAILAPNFNSYRRFKLGQHVPLEANWGGIIVMSHCAFHVRIQKIKESNIE